MDMKAQLLALGFRLGRRRQMPDLTKHPVRTGSDPGLLGVAPRSADIEVKFRYPSVAPVLCLLFTFHQVWTQTLRLWNRLPSPQPPAGSTPAT